MASNRLRKELVKKFKVVSDCGGFFLLLLLLVLFVSFYLAFGSGFLSVRFRQTTQLDIVLEKCRWPQQMGLKPRPLPPSSLRIAQESFESEWKMVETIFEESLENRRSCSKTKTQWVTKCSFWGTSRNSLELTNSNVLENDKRCSFA